MVTNPRPLAARKLATGMLISLLSAGLTFWLCRRYAFSLGRTITWTGLGMLIGPIALVLMWMFLDWPAQRRVLAAESRAW